MLIPIDASTAAGASRARQRSQLSKHLRRLTNESICPSGHAVAPRLVLREQGGGVGEVVAARHAAEVASLCVAGGEQDDDSAPASRQ